MPGLLIIKPRDSSDFHSSLGVTPAEAKADFFFFLIVLDVKIAPSAQGECIVIEHGDLKTKFKNTYKCILAD